MANDLPTFGAFKGLRNDTAPERFGPGDLVQADHVNIDAEGRLSRRAGYTQLLAGDFHSLHAQGGPCLVAGGSTLWELNPDFTLTPRVTGLTTGARLSFAEVAGRIYWSNGFERGLIDGPRARSWGLTPPANQGTASAAPGTLPAGSYQWALTFLRADGQESGTGLAGRIDLPEGGGIALAALPVSTDPDVTIKRLYVSEQNGTVLYEHQDLLAGAATATVAALPQGNYPLPTQFLTGAPAGQVIAHFNGRLLVGAGEWLYPSEPFGYELFDLRLGIPHDGPLRLLAPIPGPAGAEAGCVVATDRTTGLLTGTGPEDYRYTALSAEGAVPGSLTYVPGHHLGNLPPLPVPVWLGHTGLYACAGGQLLPLTGPRFTFDAGGYGAALYQAEATRLLALSA